MKTKIDAVLDTDTFNEIDDQFALAWFALERNKFNLKAVFRGHSILQGGEAKNFERLRIC